MLTALLLAQALGAEPERAELVAAAAASGRPAECTPRSSAGGASAASVWARARAPHRERYCTLVARAQTRVQHEPKSAQAAAREAAELEPSRAAPLVLLGQAALRLGDLADAIDRFTAAMALDSRSVEQPVALHDYATALRLADRPKEALRAYRLLVPRCSLMPSRGWRARVLLEAAHVAMKVAALGTAKPELDETLAYLREATSDPHHELRLDTSVALALALDRAGLGSQADALLAELGGLDRWADAIRSDVVAIASDRWALRALALERSRPREAAAAWKQVLASPDCPPAYQSCARSRLERLERVSARKLPRASR